MIRHTIGNYTLEEIKKLPGKHSCDIYTAKLVQKDVFLKTLNTTNRVLAQKILQENKKIRARLSAFITVPNIIHAGYENGRISILEENVGKSLGDILEKDNWTSPDVDLVLKCIEYIKTFPEDIPLDTNPYNFVVSGDATISFVDFMPPNPWDFLDNRELRVSYEKCFPSIVNAYIRRHTRKKRYYLNKYRIVKLLYYFDIKR